MDRPLVRLHARRVRPVVPQQRHALLLELQQSQIDDRDAELYAIRTGVSRLLSGDYTPNPDAIRRAVFYPDKELIDEYQANKEVGW